MQILKRRKATIGWHISDLKGISPSYCMHKINLEADYKPVRQPQRILNPIMKEEVRKEVLKILEAGLIYPILDSSWVSLVQVVPKKGGMTVVKNDRNELIPKGTVTEWRMCIDYRKLNEAIRKDQEKTIFTCPFGVFAYRRMPFGLRNAPATFQRCMMAIFADIVDKCIEVFMDDFPVFGASFGNCLANLEKVL